MSRAASITLLLDEAWDLAEAIAELEARREKVRDGILAICRATQVDRWQHARGSVSVQRYASYKVSKPTRVLGVLEACGWEDKVLQVKGRALHALAREHAQAREVLEAALPTVQHEVLTMRPRRAR